MIWFLIFLFFWWTNWGSEIKWLPQSCITNKWQRQPSHLDVTCSCAFPPLLYSAAWLMPHSAHASFPLKVALDSSKELKTITIFLSAGFGGDLYLNALFHWGATQGGHLTWWTLATGVESGVTERRVWLVQRCVVFRVAFFLMANCCFGTESFPSKDQYFPFKALSPCFSSPPDFISLYSG